MKTSHILTLAIAAAICALPLPSHAAGRGKKAPPKKMTEVAANRVVASSLTSITVTIESGQSKTYHVTAATKITVDGKDAKIGDIRSGMQANVTPAADGITADSISASAPPKK